MNALLYSHMCGGAEDITLVAQVWYCPLNQHKPKHLLIQEDTEDVNMGRPNDEGPAAEDLEADDQGAADELERRPRTREELQQLRGNFKNNMHLGKHFLADRDLQLEFRAMYLGVKHLIKEYSTAVEELRKGQETQLRYPHLLANCLELSSF